MKQTISTLQKEFLKSLGNNIRAARLKQGFTIKQLANRCGVHYSYLSLVELGKADASIMYIATVANALQTPIENLLFEAFANR